MIIDKIIPIPVVDTYRGVDIHDFQPADRVEAVVKPAIDKVYTLTDPAKLFTYADTATNPPEARLFAGARCRAVWEMAAEDRERRPNVDMKLLQATIAGLNSLRWLDSQRYTTLFDYTRSAPWWEETCAARVRAARTAIGC